MNIKEYNTSLKDKIKRAKDEKPMMYMPKFLYDVFDCMVLEYATKYCNEFIIPYYEFEVKTNLTIHNMPVFKQYLNDNHIMMESILVRGSDNQYISFLRFSW